MSPKEFVLSVREAGEQSGGAVTPYRITRRAAPYAPVSEGEVALARHILLLVHGYNDSESDATSAYQSMVDNLTAATLFDRLGGPDAIVYFQWPGDYALVPGVPEADALGYVTDLKLAFQADDQLAKFFQTLWGMGGQTLKISIITHSTGGRILMEALYKLSPLPDINVVALMAATVPVDLVTAGNGAAAYLSSLDRPPRQFRKYHSWTDVVLGIAYPAGQLLAFCDGVEKAAYGEAVGWLGNPVSFGIEPPDTGIHAHWHYWDNTAIATDIAVSIDPTCRSELTPRSLPASYELPSPYELPTLSMGS